MLPCGYVFGAQGCLARVRVCVFARCGRLWVARPLPYLRCQAAAWGGGQPDLQPEGNPLRWWERCRLRPGARR